jgi:hypothetical protein
MAAPRSEAGAAVSDDKRANAMLHKECEDVESSTRRKHSSEKLIMVI